MIITITNTIIIIIIINYYYYFLSKTDKICDFFVREMNFSVSSNEEEKSNKRARV